MTTSNRVGGGSDSHGLGSFLHEVREDFRSRRRQLTNLKNTLFNVAAKRVEEEKEEDHSFQTTEEEKKRICCLRVRLEISQIFSLVTLYTITAFGNVHCPDISNLFLLLLLIKGQPSDVHLKIYLIGGS